MSLADEARELRERVLARLAELDRLLAEREQLVAEQGELRTLAREMGWIEGGTDEPASAAAPGPAKRSAPRRRAPSGTRKASSGAGRAKGAGASRSGRGRAGAKGAAGAAQERLVAAVAASPGITVAELAAELGVASQALFAPVRALTDAGRLAKRGRQLFVPES